MAPTKNQIEAPVYETLRLNESVTENGEDTASTSKPIAKVIGRKQRADKKASPVPNNRHDHSCPKGWWFETAALVFSILSQVAIAVVLFKINGVLLSTWTFGLSPNTVVSTLSTAAKAGMMFTVSECIGQAKWLRIGKSSAKPEHLQVFDNASRGPWGSLEFMWHGRRGSLGLVTYIGCLCTFVSIALDPFAQELLSFPLDRVQLQGVNSSVTRSQVFDYGTSGVVQAGTLVIPSTAREPLLQQAAVSACFNVITAVPLLCGGSNCTYPDFTSLGLCSSCTDVTTETKVSCDITPAHNYVDCEFTTPAGTLVTAEWTSTGSMAGMKPTYTQFNTNTSSYDSLLRPNDSCIQCGTPTSADILQLSMIRFGDEGYAEPQTWQDTLKAYDCSYAFCAQSFTNWSTVNGDIVEGNRSRSALTALPIKAGFLFDFSTQDTGFPGDQTFTISMEDHRFLWEILSSAFGPSGAGSNGMFSGDYVSLIFNALYDSPDLPATVESVAVSLSNRMLVNPNSTTVLGAVFADQTFIRVQWWWFAPSVVLELTAAAFLLLTVLQTHRAGQYPWKSSLFPLIYGRGLLDTERVQAGDRDSLEMVESPLAGSQSPPSLAALVAMDA